MSVFRVEHAFVQPASLLAQRAAEIDRRADHLLALGRHIQAERLAHLAADLREAVPA